jgi:hypothetical protein
MFVRSRRQPPAVPVLAFGMNFASPRYWYGLWPIILGLLQACTSMPLRAPEASLGDSDSRTTIFVARRGWHIDIGFRTPDIREPLSSLSAQFVRSQYVFFGFGDRHYLVARNKNFPGLLAALWPGGGVMLVTMLAATPAEAFGKEHVIRLTVSSAAARAAQTFVWNSLLKEKDVPVFYRNGPYEGSLFFGAIPKYSALHTCNTWAAEALRAAGLPIHSRGVVFASQLWPQIRHIEDATAAIGAPGAAAQDGASIGAPSWRTITINRVAAH